MNLVPNWKWLALMLLPRDVMVMTTTDAICSFLLDTVAVHSRLGLVLPEPALTFMSPLSSNHKTLIRLPEVKLMCLGEQ